MTRGRQKSQNGGDVIYERSQSHFLEIDNTLSPIGTITAWVPKVDLEDGQISEIPPCWMACDGSTIPNGLWAGRNTPNLNGEGRFLRGGPIENSLLTQEDSIQSHSHSINVRDECNLLVIFKLSTLFTIYVINIWFLRIPDTNIPMLDIRILSPL